MNQLGISINRTNIDMIPEYAAAGFDVMEISLPNEPADQLREFGEKAMALAKEAGIALWSVHIPFGEELDLSNPDEEKRLKALELLRPSVELAKEWGAQVIVTHGSCELYDENDRGARIIACARSLKALQQEAGSIRVALENLPRFCLARISGEVVPLSKNCAGICFDVNHLLIQSHESFLGQAASGIITTHLSDYDMVNERHWMPGAGVVPWKLIYDTLTAAGYTGPWLFELGRNPDGTNFDPVAVLDSWAKESGL